MEDLVGIRVVDRVKGECGFITWGRVFGAIEEDELAQAVRPHLHKCGLNDVESVEVCYSLRDLSHHTYFYEALFTFARQRKPSGVEYARWLARKREAIERGREIYFLGLPRPARST